MHLLIWSPIQLLTLLDLMWSLIQQLSMLNLMQWRNSYGLRVGKPAGTRAEGAPWVPLHSNVPADITLP